MIFRIVFSDVTPASLTDAAKDANALTDAARGSLTKEGIAQSQILYSNIEMLGGGMAGVFLTVALSPSSDDAVMMAKIAAQLLAEPIVVTLSSGEQVNSELATACPAAGCPLFVPSSASNAGNDVLCPINPFKHFAVPMLGSDRRATDNPQHGFTIQGLVSTAERCADVCIKRTDCVAFQYRQGKQLCEVINGTVQESLDRMISSSSWNFYVRKLDHCDRYAYATPSPSTAPPSSVTTGTMQAPISTSEQDFGLDIVENEGDVQLEVDPNAVDAGSTNDRTASAFPFSTGTLVAILVVGCIVLTIPFVCYVSRKATKDVEDALAKKRRGKRHNKAPPKRGASSFSTFKPRRSVSASKIENWNFDSVADGVLNLPADIDEDGLTWDGEGLRLWDRDNSIKVGPRQLSISSSRKSVSLNGSIKMQQDGKWVPQPPRHSDLRAGGGRRVQGGAGGSNLNPSVLTRNRRQQESGMSMASNVSSVNLAAPVFQQRFDTIIQSRFGSLGSTGYGAEGMVGEDDVGYANHGDLGMLSTAPEFTMLDTSFAEEIDVFSSETDAAPNIEQLYSLAVGHRISRSPPPLEENIYSLAGSGKGPGYTLAGN